MSVASARIDEHTKGRGKMKTADRDKLSQCLSILNTTSLGLPLVWLWTWSTIIDILDDESYHAEVNLDTAWTGLCEAVQAGKGFSLEYGSEQHHDDVLEWMLEQGYILDPVDELEEDED
jgi:hypothetical protein